MPGLRQRYFPAPPPTSTVVEVKALARPEFMIEVEAEAVIPVRRRHPVKRQGRKSLVRKKRP